MLQNPNKIPENLLFDIKSIQEEKANMYSHLLGVVFALIFSPFLLYKTYLTHTNSIFIGVLIFIFGFTFMFTASTIYHNSYDLAKRKIYRTFDHIAIYFMISGTYTATILLFVQDKMGFIVLISLWVATIIGTIFKLFFVGRFKIVSTLIYLIMGWAAILIINTLIEVMPDYNFYWLIAGGLSYTIGTFFYIKKTIYLNHFYWHLFVLAGAIFHFIMIYLSI